MAERAPGMTPGRADTLIVHPATYMGFQIEVGDDYETEVVALIEGAKSAGLIQADIIDHDYKIEGNLFEDGKFITLLTHGKKREANALRKNFMILNNKAVLRSKASVGG